MASSNSQSELGTTNETFFFLLFHLYALPRNHYQTSFIHSYGRRRDDEMGQGFLDIDDHGAGVQVRVYTCRVETLFVNNLIRGHISWFKFAIFFFAFSFVRVFYLHHHGYTHARTHARTALLSWWCGLTTLVVILIQNQKKVVRDRERESRGREGQQ